MKLVVDANVLFAVLIKEGKTDELFFSDELKLFAPEYILEEFQKYQQEILEKTKRNKKEFQTFLNILKRRLTLIPNYDLKDFINSATEISIDQKDSVYFALAIKLKCSIWSNDNDFKKQDKIKIYSTEELIKNMSK